jgi:hypothetical protein
MSGKIQAIAIGQLKTHPDNPRFIKDEKFKKLLKSLQQFPDMMQVRPLIVTNELVILGGNMRYQAMIELGWESTPVIKVNWSLDQQKEFIIKDNVSYGEWDYDVLANEWEAKELNDWGVDVWSADELKSTDELKRDAQGYSREIKSPHYEPKQPLPPNLFELYNRDKTDRLIEKINDSDIPENVKDFLRIAALRHVVFSYEKIAEYYAHASVGVQELMEESALIVIDYDKAIENGYVRLGEKMRAMYETAETAEITVLTDED